MKHIKQLDSLRAISVIFVIMSHWLGENFILNRLTHDNLSVLGVNTFFVLSGFLITGILFENKRQAEALHIAKYVVIKNFFFRRGLRIFPIYYLFLTIVWIFHRYSGTHITDNFIYFYTYTANFYFSKIKTWDGMLSPLWSLSVEEQFYLIWPWMILFCKDKFLLPLIVTFITVGILSNYLFSNALTVHFDAFGLGAVLSWQIVYHPSNLKRFYGFTRVAGGLCVLLFFYFIIVNPDFLLFNTVCCGISLWVITYVVACQGQRSRLNTFLSNRLLVSTGKVSYGLYIYHLMVYFFLINVLKQQGRNEIFGIPLHFYTSTRAVCSISLALLIIITFLSYHFIELPLLSLKRYFELPREKPLFESTDSGNQASPIAVPNNL